MKHGILHMTPSFHEISSASMTDTEIGDDKRKLWIQCVLLVVIFSACAVSHQ